MGSTSTLTLEVGKTYKMRLGFDRVTIKRQRPEGRYPFVGDNGRSYSEHGLQVWNGSEWLEMHNDLVKEVKIGL